MATFNLILKNPFPNTTTYNIKSNGGITRVKLSPNQTKDLTEVHPGFVVLSGATDTTVHIGKRISDLFMSGNGHLEVVMRDFQARNTGIVTIRNKPYTEFFSLAN